MRTASLVSLANYVRDTIDTVCRIPEASFPCRSSATLPGLAISALHSDDTFARAVGSNFVSPYPDQEALPSIEKLKVFTVHPGTEGVPAPSKWPNEPYQPHRLSEIAEFGLRVSHYHDLDQWHMYDVRHGIALQLMTDAGAFPPWEPAAPLRPFLHWHYAERGMRLAHAGTLGVDGVGVLLAGAGGSGKSGTVMAGLVHGLQSVGDDYVLLSFDSKVTARPIYSTLKQNPEGFRRLGLQKMMPEPGAVNWQGKYEVSLRELSRVPVPSALRIGALLVPRVTHAAATKITPLSRGEAMMALASSSIHQMQDERESGFRFFGDVTKRLPCFRLDLGREGAEIAGAISRFIEELPR